MVEVLLEDILGTLTTYAAGIAGIEVAVLPRYYDLVSRAAEQTIFLPASVKVSESTEDNFFQYKILATLEAACLRHAQEPIGKSGVEYLRKKGIKVEKDKTLQYHFEMDVPKDIQGMFYTLFKIIEFGRIRQQLATEYPALNTAIDDYLEENQAYKRPMANIRSKEMTINVTQMLLSHHIEQGKGFALDFVGLGYLLLFSEKRVERAKERIPRSAVELYQEVFPQISGEYATRSDSARIAFEILGELSKEAGKAGKKPEDLMRCIDGLVTGMGRNIPLSPSSHERFQKNLQLTPQERNLTQGVFYADEWDCGRGRYIREVSSIKESWELPTSQGEEIRFSVSTIEIAEIKKALQVLTPEGRVETRKLSSGDFDLDDWVKYKTDVKLGTNPAPRFYRRVERRERDVAQLILWDIGGSGANYTSRAGLNENMRAIDMMKFGLIHYIAALSELSDDLALYAYNSRGRNEVRVYPIVQFGELFSPTEVAVEIARVKPSLENLDGAAIRHVVQNYLAEHSAETRLLLHVNDGVPEDKSHTIVRGMGSREDKDIAEYSGKYAIEDVKKALDETRDFGIIPFGISFAREDAREMLKSIWGSEYKMLKTPYSLGRKLGQVLIEKTRG